MPHQGAQSSSEPGFIGAVSPGLAVISCGINRFGHPSKEILSELAKCGADVYRTDRVGAVTIRVGKDGGIKLETMIDE